VPIVALFDEQRQPVDALSADQHGYAALARTPFYLEAGGQCRIRPDRQRGHARVGHGRRAGAHPAGLPRRTASTSPRGS